MDDYSAPPGNDGLMTLNYGDWVDTLINKCSLRGSELRKVSDDTP